MSINSGDFEDVIIGNIKARAHFLLVLTPTVFERCENPEDWVRREIECAIKTKRNIVPLMFENFDFNDSSVKKTLTGSLAILNRYNGLRMPDEYFDEGMLRLRDRFLNIPLEAVLKPLSNEVKTATKQQKDVTESVISKLVSSPLIREDTISLQAQEPTPLSKQKKDVLNPKNRPLALTGFTFRVETPLGKSFVTINEDNKHQPFEVFVNTAKAGSETAAVSEAIGRLISLTLRATEYAEPLDRLGLVVRQLSGIGGGRSLGFGPNRVRSLPDGIGQGLDQYITIKTTSKKIEDNNNDK